MKKQIPIILITALVSNACSNEEKGKALPNIIYILADDLGYGDLSCYGQTNFATPNIDEMAKQGMQFSQHYSGSTVCAPSRCSLLSGMHTGHSFIRCNKVGNPEGIYPVEGQYPIPDSVVTIAEILKEKGYATGAFGKWSLGFTSNSGDPLKQGFDEFYGFYCQGLAHNYYPYSLWHNNEKIMLSENEGTKQGSYAPDLIHEMAMKFLENNRDKPFFMYYPTIIPHAELFAKEKYMEKFRGKFMPEVYYQSRDSAKRYKIGSYGTQPESHAAFAALITQLDDYVGDIILKVKQLGLEENTIIIFSSDNGPHLEGGADPDYFDSNGALKGYKRDVYEGGIRVPMIVKWPGVVKPGSKSDHISAFWDVMPTLADIAGVSVSHKLDGISFLSSLTGKGKQQQHNFLYWEFHVLGGKMAVRMGDWKSVKLNINNQPQGKTELYNLSNDIGENNDVAADNPEILEKMEAIMKKARIPSRNFPLEIDQFVE